MAAFPQSSSSSSAGYDPEQDLKAFDAPVIDADHATEQQLAAAEKHVQQLEIESKNKEAQLIKSRNELVAARIKLIDEKGIAEAEQARLEKAQEELIEELNKLKGQDAEMKEAIEACEKQLAEFQKQIDAEERKIQQVNEVLAKQQSELDAIERRLAALAAEIKVCQDQIEKLKADDALANVAVADAEHELKEAQEEKAAADDELRTKLEEKHQSEAALVAAQEAHIQAELQKRNAKNVKQSADRELELERGRLNANEAAVRQAEANLERCREALQSASGGSVIHSGLSLLCDIGASLVSGLGALFGGAKSIMEEERKRTIATAEERVRAAERSLENATGKFNTSEAAVQRAEANQRAQHDVLQAANALLKTADMRLTTAKEHTAAAVTAHHKADIAQRKSVANTKRASTLVRVANKSKAQIAVLLDAARTTEAKELKLQAEAENKCRGFQIEIARLQDVRESFVAKQQAKQEEQATLNDKRYKLQGDREKLVHSLQAVEDRIEFNAGRMNELAVNEESLAKQIKYQDRVLTGLRARQPAYAQARAVIEKRRAALAAAAAAHA